MKATVDALVQVALYSAAITAGILLFRFILKNRISSKLQYLMWWLLILRLLMPVTPDIGLHFNLQDMLLKQAHQAELPTPAPVLDVAPASVPNTQSSYESVAPAVQPDTDVAPSQHVNPAKSTDWYSIVFVVWLLGAIGFLGWLIFVKLRYYESLQHLMAGGPREVYELYDRCCKELGVKPLPLWIVNKSMSPGIAFFGEPVLLVPISLCGDESRLRFALLHELTHKKRGDHYMTLLLNILRAVYWFDPVVHFAFSELRADMESACDSDVLAYIGHEQKRGYLTVILDMFSYDTEPILGMSQIRSKRMAKRRMKGAFMKNRTSPAFRAITLCIALIMSLCCFTTACQSAPEKDISSELNEPLSINTDTPDGFSERVAMENLQRTGAIRHLNYFSEPPRGAGGFSTECAGDFDGDGKFDKAYIAGQSIIIELSGEKIEVSAETISEPEFYIGGYFFIEGADLTGNGKNEIVLLVDTGGNGGLGVCNLIVLQNTSSGWKPIDGVPFHGVSVSMTWKDNMCKITSGSYCENVADGYMMQQHYEQAGSGDNWAAVDGVEYSSENAADPPCDIAVIREQNRSKIVITQYITGPTGVHVDQLGYMDTTFAFNDDGSCDIDNKCFVLFPYDAEKPSDARPAAATYAFDRTDPKQAVAEFLTRYLDDMAHGNDDFGFDSSNSTMYDGLLQLQGNFESHKNIALLRQWINFTQVLRETTVPAIDMGRFQSLEITEFGIVDQLSGGIMYEYLLKGYFKTTVMGTFIEAGLIKDGDKYVITYVDFPDSKEYQNFCADFIDYAERNDIKDYNKNAYIEYIRKQKQQAAEMYPIAAPESDPSSGLTSSAIADIQSALKALGYLENPSGTYDSATRAAIEMFQEDNALPSDGIAGDETLALLLSDSAKNWTLADGIYTGDKRIWRDPPKDGVDGWSSITADKISAYSGSSVTSTGAECKLGTASVNPNAIPIGTELYIPGYGYAIATDVNAYKNKVNHLTKEPLNMIDLWFASKEDARKWENKHNFTILYRSADARPAREAPTADAIAATAKNQVGKEYVLNASGPDEFDCSGLVYYVLNECGIAVDRKDCAGYAQNEDWGKIESLSDVKAGDILFFHSANSSDIQHAGIAVSSKNMIDASSSHRKVVKRSCNTDYWNRNFAFARRVVE